MATFARERKEPQKAASSAVASSQLATIARDNHQHYVDDSPPFGRDLSGIAVHANARLADDRAQTPKDRLDVERAKNAARSCCGIRAVYAELKRVQEIIDAGRDPHSLIRERKDFRDKVMESAQDLP